MNVVTSNQEPKLTQPITENPSAPDWGLATIMRDKRESAVIREPDEGD